MKNYIRNILIFFVAFSLVIGLSIVPSFADTFLVSNNQGQSSSFSFFTSLSPKLYKINGSDVGISSNVSADIYAFYTGNDNVTFATTTPNVTVYFVFYNSSTNSRSLSLNYNNGSLYYNTATVSATEFYISQYSTVDLGLAAIRDYIDNPPVEVNTYNAYFDIPCGNVAYIKTGNDNTLTLSCTMPEFSKLTGSTGTYWTNTMEIAYGVPSYPPAGTTFPLSSMSYIQWFRSTEGRDLLGRTKKALFLDTTHSSDNFIVIYNPTYRELTTSGQGDINPTIRVQCSALVDYHMYSLTGEYNSQGTISSYSIDGFSDPYVGTPTSDNENVLGTNSAGATPNLGGSGNEIGGTGGIIEYVQGIQYTLDNFANSFISLLKAPISHILSLISSGTDYFNVIRGLYGWLPDEVQGTINSAMIVSISVGVIALLL